VKPIGVRPSHGYAFVTGAAYGLLIIVGALLALVGTFQHGRLNLVLSGGGGTFSRLPVGALLIIFVTGGLCWLAGWGMRSRLAAVVLGVTWLVVSYLFSMPRPGGDVLIAGDLAGGVYLYGGLILAGIAMVTAPSAHRVPPAAPMLGGAVR
jgi:hypothetical protein